MDAVVVIVLVVGEDADGDVGEAPAIAAAVKVATVGAAVVDSRRSVDMRLCDRLEEVDEVDDFLDRMIRLEDGFTCSMPE